MRRKKKIEGFTPAEIIKPQENKGVDLSKLETVDIKVTVNGIETPLKIGDVVQIEIQDTKLDDPISVPMTIGGIVISGDGTISYICEWNSGMEIHSETMSLSELKRLQLRI